MAICDLHTTTARNSPLFIHLCIFGQSSEDCVYHCHVLEVHSFNNKIPLNRLGSMENAAKHALVYHQEGGSTQYKGIDSCTWHSTS